MKDSEKTKWDTVVIIWCPGCENKSTRVLQPDKDSACPKCGKVGGIVHDVVKPCGLVRIIPNGKVGQ